MKLDIYSITNYAYLYKVETVKQISQFRLSFGKSRENMNLHYFGLFFLLGKSNVVYF